MNKQGAKYKISPRGKRKLDYPTKLSKPSVKLPLRGKTIYLDVKEAKQLKRLQEDLKKLGATLEDFVSRDINYLITSQPRPKNKAASPCGDDSPTPSPFNCDPSPSPGYPEDKKVTSVTRGKALLEKARYTRQASTLLDNAEKWGVKIVTVEGAFKWIDKELKKLPKSGSLCKKNIKPKCVSSYKLFKSPFVKLEADTFCYRPFHTELDVWPRLNVDTPRGSCPFDGTLIKGGEESREERGELLAAQVDIPSEDTPKEEKDGSESAASTPKPAAEKSDVFAGNKIMTAGELKRRKELKRKQERKRGYCECCHVKYEDLDKHVKEDQHRQYVKTKTNYSQLDTLINSGPNTQHFLFEYLRRAAHIVNVKNGNSNNLSIENSIRRSPRKAVQESTLKSLIRSPSKTAQKPTVHSPKKCQSPGKANKAVSLQSVRVSPRKSLQKLTNSENLVSPSKTKETKQSAAGRSCRNNETKTAEASLDVHASINNTGTAGGCRTPRLRQHTVLQKENVTGHSHGKETSNFRKVLGIVEEKRKDSEVTSSKNAVNNEKELIGKTLSEENSNKILENSPKKKVSPRKQLIKSFAQENEEDIKGCQDLDKENITPCKQKLNIKETHTQKPILSKEPQDNNTEELVTSLRKCTEKSLKNNTDLVKNSNQTKLHSCDESLNKSFESSVIGTSTDELDIDNYELTKVGFAEIVKYGKKRTEIEHSSDDFEVCFARSLDGETLPMLKKTNDEAVEKTFDDMIVQCEKSGVINDCNDSLSLPENETEVDVNRTRKLPHKKLKHLENEVLIGRKIASEQTKKDTSLTKSQKKKHEKEKDVFDIDMESDIPSDFQCYNEEGKLLTFSKTLAERIKERSLGRRSSVESYNMNVLFQLPSRSRSNSFSSNQSDRTTKKVASAKSKKVLNNIDKKKTGSSIACAKVLNKYRNKRFGRAQNENNQTGYQGDDENEKTPEIRKLEQGHVSQKKPRKKFWHYEPVVESEEKPEPNKELKGLAKELQKLREASAWCSSDISDTETQRSRKKLGKIENNECKTTEAFISNKNNIETSGKVQEGENKPKKKFWYYVSVSTEDDLEKESQSDQNAPRESRNLKNLSTNFDAENETRKARRNGNSSDKEYTRKIMPATSNKTEVAQHNKCTDVDKLEELEKVKVKKQNNLSDHETCRIDNIKNVKSKRNKKVYWDYVPVVNNSEEESSLQVPKRFRDTCNSGDTLDRYKRRKNRDKPEKVDTDAGSTDECCDQNSVAKKLNRNQCELDRNNDLGESEEEMKNVKPKTGKKYWDFVPVEPVENNMEGENASKIPKNLRDSWNSGDSLNRYDRRNSRKLTEYVEIDVSSTDEGQEEIMFRKRLRRKPHEHFETSDKLGATEKEMKKAKLKTGKKFWDYIPVEDNIEGENASKIPKNLRDSWNSGDSLNRYDRRNSRKLTEYVEIDVSSTDEGQEEIMFRKRLRRKPHEHFETSDKLGATEKEMKKAKLKTGKKFWDYIPVEDNIEGENASEIPKELRDPWNTGDTLNKYDRRNRGGLVSRHLRKRENRVNYSESDSRESESDISNCENNQKITETDFESGVNDTVEICDKKLRKLAQASNKCLSVYSGTEEISAVENMDVDTERMNSKNSKHNCEANAETEDIVLNKSNSITVNTHSGEEAKNSDSDTDRQGNADDFNNSDSQSRSRSRKKVFWEYEVVPVEESSVKVDKTLPKELQILQSTWNDLKTVDRRSRSRSCQSGPDASDTEKSNCERGSRKCEKYLKSQHIVADKEISFLTERGERSLKDSDTVKVNNDGKGAALAGRYSGKVKKDSVTNDSANEHISDEEDERSASPVFNVVQNHQNKVMRRRSPVFNRSPRQQLQSAENGKSSVSSQRKEHKINSQKYAVKGKSNKPFKGSNVHSETNERCFIVDNFSKENEKRLQYNDDYCSDSEDESCVNKNKKDTILYKANGSADVVKTPEKSAPVKQPGSGYSNTPRGKRRKQWKRKNEDTESAHPKEKIRKLEDTADAVEPPITTQTNVKIKTTPRRRLLESELKENQKISETNDVQRDYIELEEKVQNTGHDNMDDQTSLTWKPVSADKVENKCEKVKLNRSWTMLSERSVSKLLSSEDDNENFDGFTDEDKLPSDMSYEEQSEVELPHDDQHEWVVEDKEEKSDIEENLVQYVPVFFPSPNKTSNSSWNDAIEGYIDNSVKHGPDTSFKGNSSSMYFSFNCSPRKSPSRRNFQSPFKVTGQVNSSKMLCSPVRASRQCTPKSKRNRQMHSPEVERVDAEIEFNFGSPQKNRSDFSPLRTVNGVVRNLSGTSNLTSTPVLKKSKKQKHRKH
ncbi:uncharacterized protein LOC123531062 [Mercenaria mercenaria]|uniref:uncharacterized protein LOC123531062 n=1 Tax=Mercenaria mercenaria TaxID=6596 RepID=UPI00234E6950|nr:uncharacterized protein LOC123531062 [Mercenaria mercenaria]